MVEGLYWAIFFLCGILVGILGITIGIAAGWYLLLGARHHSQNMYKNLMQQQQQQQTAEEDMKVPVAEPDNRKYYGIRETMQRLQEDDVDEDS